MSSYLLLTYNVCNMGGAQLYVLRRALYLKEKGYSVYIIVCFDNGYFPLKKQFGDIPIWCCPEMTKPYVTVNEKKGENIIKEVKHFASVDNETIIESHTLSTIEWGEIIASSYNCKHLAYPLSEIPVSSYKFRPGRKIFEEKLINNELYGLSDASLEIIFGRPCSPNNYVNVGFDENELAETSIPSIGFAKKGKDYVISTIARLDKTYIEKLISDTIRLAKKYQNQEFVLIIAGGSKTGNRQDYLFNKYNHNNIPCKNLLVIFTGYITTLGRDLFLLSDVVVGTGLAAINSISLSRVTIVIDETTDTSTGFFGTDTNNFGYGSLKKSFSIYEKLEEAYNAKPETINKIKESGRALFLSDFEINLCFEKLDKTIEQIKRSRIQKYLSVSIVYRYYSILSLFFKSLIKKVIKR